MNDLEIIKLKSRTIVEKQDSSDSNDDLYVWANKYYHLFVVNSPNHTQRAKKVDLDKFLLYFTSTLRTNNPDFWTSAITRGFQNYLSDQSSPKTGLKYTATTINRILATIRHFGNWLYKERGLLAGKPFTGVRLTVVEEPAWNGLTNTDITRLKAACDMRLNACWKKNQDPLLEYTVFMILLTTGLRESELASLNVEQYHVKGLHNVKRKGNKVTKKVPIINETRELLDKYLATRENLTPLSPLLTTRYGARILTRDIARICERIARQANAKIPKNEQIKLTPHMLRHTFLKKIADKHGIHAAQDLSGNISTSEIFRYTRPNASQKQEIVEELFNY
jgi:integrase/recombinase XerD